MLTRKMFRLIKQLDKKERESLSGDSPDTWTLSEVSESSNPFLFYRILFLKTYFVLFVTDKLKNMWVLECSLCLDQSHGQKKRWGGLVLAD